MLRRLQCHRDNGQELVEYAIVLPLLMLLLLGIMEFAIVIFSYDTIANAAREGARYGIIHPTDTAGIEAVARDRALGLNQAGLQVTPTLVGDAIQVEVTYDVSLITGLIIQAVGGPTLQLRTAATMQIE